MLPPAPDVASTQEKLDQAYEMLQWLNERF